jgi:mono/diheme cytochrome c family protein
MNMFGRMAAAGTVALAAAACDARPSHFPLDFERMRDQPQYRPYERSSFFDDRKTMRELPEGTVPVGADDGLAGIDREATGSAPAAETSIAITRELIERGRRRYDVFCAACHGIAGTGDSPVAENMALRKPPSLVGERVRQMPVGRIYQVIAEGYGLMPSYAHALTIEERWGVVAYVRALQLSQAVELKRLPPQMQAEAAKALATGAR